MQFGYSVLLLSSLCAVFPGNIRIKSFCHQQKSVPLLHAQRHCVGGMEKNFIMRGYSKLVKQIASYLRICHDTISSSYDFVQFIAMHGLPLTHSKNCRVLLAGAA